MLYSIYRDNETVRATLLCTVVIEHIVSMKTCGLVERRNIISLADFHPVLTVLDVALVAMTIKGLISRILSDQFSPKNKYNHAFQLAGSTLSSLHDTSVSGRGPPTSRLPDLGSTSGAVR